MNRPPEIHVTIDPQGKVTVHTRGYRGKSCVEASRFLEEALGGGATVCVTPEYYVDVLHASQTVGHR